MAVKPAPQLCVLTIGYMRLLLPFSKGISAIKMLQGALACEFNTDPDYREIQYFFGEQVSIECALVSSEQIAKKPEHVAPVSRTRKNLLLEDLE
jgi:hypothetical protein